MKSCGNLGDRYRNMLSVLGLVGRRGLNKWESGRQRWGYHQEPQRPQLRVGFVFSVRESDKRIDTQ